MKVSRFVTTLNKQNGEIKESIKIAYFISSLSPTLKAERIGVGIRGHWSIENALHYVKDVTFLEDRSKIVSGNAPENISMLKNIVINIFRKNGVKNLAQEIRFIAHDIQKLANLILA